MRSTFRCFLLGAGTAAIGLTLVVLRPPLTPNTLQRGDDLAIAVAWFVAIATSGYLTAIAWASSIALAAGQPRVAARIARKTPLVRRIVEVAVASSWLALSTVPAGAFTRPRPPIVHDVPVVRTPLPPARTVVRTSPARPRTRPSAPSSPPSIHLVRAGDNLWLIAHDTLVAAGRRRPSDIEIARYWRAVIAQNRATLRSRDPSLIYPGEIVTLPPVK